MRAANRSVESVPPQSQSHHLSTNVTVPEFASWVEASVLRRAGGARVPESPEFLQFANTPIKLPLILSPKRRPTGSIGKAVVIWIPRAKIVLHLDRCFFLYFFFFFLFFIEGRHFSIRFFTVP